MTPFSGLLADETADYAFFPEAASTFAAANDWLFAFISWIAVAFFIPIAFCLFYFAVKYRKKKGEKAESNVAHNTPLEVAWSVFPSFFLVGMFVIGAKHYLDQRMVPEGAREVGVTAYQWGWNFDYGAGVGYDELHVVKGEPVKLAMRSNDVIHSLYVPAFRAKKDIVPGRYNYMWFEPTNASEKVSDQELEDAKAKAKELGEWDLRQIDITKDGYRYYDLYCTEYCGTSHSQMNVAVVVHETEAELKEWIKEKSKRPEGVSKAEYGEILYARKNCKGCHSNDGSAMVGPTFKNLYGSKHGIMGGDEVTVDANYVRESILYPAAKIVAGYRNQMPSFKGQLSDDDLESLIAYLRSISENTPKSELGLLAEEDSDSAEETAGEGADAGADTAPEKPADDETDKEGDDSDADDAE